MADEVVAPAVVVPAEAPVVAAPVVEAPVVAAPEVAPVAPAPVEVPAVAEVAAPAAPELPTAAPTLLEGIKSPAEEAAPAEVAKPAEPEKAVEAAKPADAPVVEAPKPPDGEKPAEVEAAPVEPPKPDPIAYKWDDNIPEGLTLDDAQRTSATAALDAFRADPTNPRPLLDEAAKMIQNYADHTLENQHKQFWETRQEWQKEILSDPILGGNGHKTAMTKAAEGRNMLISDHAPGTEGFKADKQAFDNFCHATGAGDHPVLAHIFYRAQRIFAEPAMAVEGKPPPDNGRKPGANPLHDNPRSHANGR